MTRANGTQREYRCTKCDRWKCAPAFARLNSSHRAATTERETICRSCQNRADGSQIAGRAARLEQRASVLRIQAGRLQRQALELRLLLGRPR